MNNNIHNINICNISKFMVNNSFINNKKLFHYIKNNSKEIINYKQSYPNNNYTTYFDSKFLYTYFNSKIYLYSRLNPGKGKRLVQVFISKTDDILDGFNDGIKVNIPKYNNIYHVSVSKTINNKIYIICHIIKDDIVINKELDLYNNRIAILFVSDNGIDFTQIKNMGLDKNTWYIDMNNIDNKLNLEYIYINNNNLNKKTLQIKL